MIWLWIYLAVVILTVSFTLWCLGSDRMTLNFEEWIELILWAPFMFILIVAFLIIYFFDDVLNFIKGNK